MPNKPLLLDAGPLGMIAHPKPNYEFARWFDSLLDSDIKIIVPEITDFEVRRSFLLNGMSRALERLNQLKIRLNYLPITTEMMLQAAQFWADARKRGHPVGDPKELNGDVILAAQAVSVDGIVVTENVGHLAQFADARSWKDIS